MIETARNTPVKPPRGSEPQEDAPDFLLRTAAVRLADLAIALAGEVPKIPEAHKGNIARVSIGLMEVLQNLNAALKGGGAQPPQGPPIAGTPEKSDNDPMETRLKALETDMRDARERLIRVEVKLDGLEKKVDLLPSKDFVVSEVSKSSTKIITWVVVAIGAAQLIPSLVVPLLKHFGI